MNKPAAFRAIKRPYKKREIEPLQTRIECGVMLLAECGCWIWERHVDDIGYGTISVEGLMMKAHRASWTAFKGPIPTGEKVLHKCDVRCCVNPDHLFLGDQIDNMRDMIRKGRGPNLNGEINPNSKLTTAEALEIKNSPLGCAELGRLYKISASMASSIKLGKNWTHL